LTDIPDKSAYARFRGDFGPRFLLTVDTEEEFDWSAPFLRHGHSLGHVARLRKFQQFCEGAGVVPVYLIDYPVATSTLAAEILREPLAAGRAEIGIQLHPWVNPPHSEELNDHNSFAGNLPPALEDAKFGLLKDTIITNFGVQPTIYRAGRYGIGPNTAAILRKHSIPIDSSVRARFDYSSTGGRNFRDHPATPYWADEERRLLELPLTTVFTGALGRFGPALYPALWRVPRMRGVLARLGLLERVPLTPEGITPAEAIRAIDRAQKDGLPLLVFSFHSPSLEPGHTPYVRNESDLDGLYDWWREVFAHCLRQGIRPTRVSELMAAITLGSRANA
jgi:hypothetical protein